MADMSLRLPNSTFRAVLNLGDKPASSFTLPTRFVLPELDMEWQEDEQETGLYISFPEGQLHLAATAEGIQYHFHGDDGEHRDSSPWPEKDTKPLVVWASALIGSVHTAMPNLLEDIEEAAAWHEAGYTLYVCSTEPAQLDLLEVEIEGEIFTLPWLGAGSVDQEHIDGENHPVALLWSEEDDGAQTPIARAWLDHNGEPATAALPGVDWLAVGLPVDEVLSWLEGTYLNHHVIPDAATALVQAVLERMGGLAPASGATAS
ncbi:MAG: hypothetical protein ABI400_04485 [Lacisediminihabitans sp.]